MAKNTTPSQQQVPSPESEYLNQSVESIGLTPPEIVNRTSTGTIVHEEISAPSDERRYATHWGINE
jgi:hypothetical protein